MYDILQLNDKLVSELKEIALNLGIKGTAKLTKQDLIYKILDEQALAEKNAADRIVPVVDEPNPQTGRRPRKVAAAEPPAQEQAPKAQPKEKAAPAPARARKERVSPSAPPAPAAPETAPRPPEAQQPPRRDDNNRRDQQLKTRETRDSHDNRENRDNRPEAQGQGRKRDRWEERRDRRQREWEERRKDRQQNRPGQPGLFDSDAAKLQNLEEEFIPTVNNGDDDEEMLPMHRPFAPLAGAPLPEAEQAPAAEQPKPKPQQEQAEVMPPHRPPRTFRRGIGRYRGRLGNLGNDA
jgi:Transcription termination factor